MTDRRIRKDRFKDTRPGRIIPKFEADLQEDTPLTLKLHAAMHGVVAMWEPTEEQQTRYCYLATDGELYDITWNGTIMRNFGYDLQLLANFVEAGSWKVVTAAGGPGRNEVNPGRPL